MLLTILSFVVVLGILVFIHELGHYLVARRNGIVVEEFGIGYPPRVAKLFRYDGTDFTLNLLPFGGFARMKGEDAGDMSPGSFNAASLGGRAATLAAGPAMNAMLAIVLFAASYVVGFPASAGHPQLLAVAPGSAAEQLGLRSGDILMSYAGLPIQVSVNADAQVAIKQPAQAAAADPTLIISRNGELIAIPVDSAQTAQALVAAGQYVPVLSTEVSGLAPDSPAIAAGVLVGDQIFSVNDAIITPDNPLHVEVKEHLGKPITLTLWRDGAWTTVNLTPRADPPPGQGAIGVQISPVTEMASLGLLPAIWEGILSTGEYALTVLQLPVMLVLGQLSPSEAQLTGPVGIAQMVGGAVSATIDTGLWFPILRLSAVLSAALAITNLLPLPALDGGRLVFILIEMVRGRRVSPEREGLIHMIGFVLLLGLMLVITVRDLSATPQSIDWAKLMGQ